MVQKDIQLTEKRIAVNTYTPFIIETINPSIKPTVIWICNIFAANKAPIIPVVKSHKSVILIFSDANCKRGLTGLNRNRSNVPFTI